MKAFFVHLLRHGAPETPGLLLGHADVPVTSAGIAACVEQVAGLPFQAITASDLQRSAMTAAAIGEPRQMKVALDPRWRELDFGAWDGIASAQIDRQAMAAFWDDPDANPPPEGERWSALVARVTAALEALPGQDTLVVTHGGAIRAALASLFGFEQRHLWAFDLPYAALVSVRVWPGTPRLAQIAGLWS